MSETKILLSERTSAAAHNIAADLDSCRKPPLRGNEAAGGADDLAPLFPMALIEQEVSMQR